MDQIMQTVNSLLSQWSTMVTLLTIVIALCHCFLGYRFVKIWVALSGFVVGFGVGYVFCRVYLDLTDLPILIIGILTGIIFAGAFFAVFKVGLFAMVAGITVWSMMLLPWPQVIQNIPYLTYILIAGAGALLGFLAVTFQRPLIIVVTAITGSYRTVSYLLPAANTVNQDRIIRIGIIVVLAALGILVQFFMNPKD